MPIAGERVGFARRDQAIETLCSEQLVDRADQLDLLADALTGERARLADLKGATDAASPLGSWLDLELGQIDAKITWCERLRTAV